MMNKTLAAGQAAAAEEWIAAGVRASLGDLGDPAASLYPRRLKALCEVSFLEFCAGSRPSPPIRAALRQTFLTLPLPHLLSLLRHNLVHANLLLPILTAMKADRLLQAAEQSDLERLLLLCARYSKERLPFRQLDLLHGLHRISGRPAYLVELIAAARLGCLGRLRFPHDVDLRDDYAVTHTVLYATDFGRRRWPRTLAHPNLVEEVLDRLSWRAEAALNLDLLAEYALCRLCLGRLSPRLDEELDHLVARFDHGGFWRGPADLGPLLEREGLSLGQREFFENYHTTLLAREVLIRARGTSHRNVRRRSPPPASGRVGDARPRRTVERFWLPRASEAPASPLERLRESYTQLLLAVAKGGQLRLHAIGPIDSEAHASALASEMAYWTARAGGRPAEHGLPQGFDRLPLDPLAGDAELQPRLFARHAVGRAPILRRSDARALFDSALQRAEARPDAAVDALVSACLLAGTVAVPASRRTLPLTRLLRRALASAAMAGDAGSFSTLLAYGLETLRDEHDVVAQCLDFLLSMSSASLPFGWTTAIGPLTADARVRQEIRGLQAALALVLARVLSPTALAWQPLPTTDRRRTAGSGPTTPVRPASAQKHRPRGVSQVSA